MRSAGIDRSTPGPRATRTSSIAPDTHRRERALGTAGHPTAAPGVDTSPQQQVERVLASFVSPARAGVLAGELVDRRDPLEATVALLRDRYGDLLRDLHGTEDAALVVALDAAGVRPAAAARLVGVDQRTAHRWLDEEQTLTPVSVAPEVPRALEVGRRVVRLVWIALAVAVVVLVVQGQGGVLPCPDQLCIDWVDVEVADGSSIAASDRSVFGPAEVEAVRFRHRAPDDWIGTLVWTVGEEEALRSNVTLRGSDVLTVAWPGRRLPVGVHVVRLLEGPADASVTFVVERD